MQIQYNPKHAEQIRKLDFGRTGNVFQRANTFVKCRRAEDEKFSMDYFFADGCLDAPDLLVYPGVVAGKVDMEGGFLPLANLQPRGM